MRSSQPLKKSSFLKCGSSIRVAIQKELLDFVVQMEVTAVAKLGVVIAARLLDLALQGLVGHLARGIAVVSNLARFRTVAEGERLLP